MMAMATDRSRSTMSHASWAITIIGILLLSTAIITIRDVDHTTQP